MADNRNRPSITAPSFGQPVSRRHRGPAARGMTAGDAGQDDASRADRNRVRHRRRGHRRQGHRPNSGERRLQVIEGKGLWRHPMHIEAVNIAKLHGLVEHRFAMGGDEDDIGGALPIGEELQKLHAVMIGKGEIENDAVGWNSGYRAMVPRHV